MRRKVIEVIAQTITGDNEISFYRTGPELVRFFNEWGFDDYYGQGFPSRWKYTEDKITEILKDNLSFPQFINFALSEKNYDKHQENPYEIQDKIIQYWNEYLEKDDYKIMRNGNNFYVTKASRQIITIPETHLDILSTEFMNEQIQKCQLKILNCDFDGAITNARTLVEEVLLEIEYRKLGERGDNDGDINNLYKRVKGLVNFDPSQENLNKTLKQILSGLNSIVVGVGTLRSKASDSHAQQYKPQEHHARLAVNTAMTFTSFIIESYIYQQSK